MHVVFTEESSECLEIFGAHGHVVPASNHQDYISAIIALAASKLVEEATCTSVQLFAGDCIILHNDLVVWDLALLQADV